MAFSLGTPELTASAVEPSAGAKGKGLSEGVKQGLAQGGINAGAGLLGGLAQALMMPDEKEERGRSSLPAGSPGAIHKTPIGGMDLQRQNLPNPQSYAAQMLGYK